VTEGLEILFEALCLKDGRELKQHATFWPETRKHVTPSAEVAVQPRTKNEPATSKAIIKPLTAPLVPILQVENHSRRQLLYGARDGAMDQPVSNSLPAFNPAIMRGRRWTLNQIRPYPAISRSLPIQSDHFEV